jgi:type IV secretory pathway ATPase VirB11/archaellum biosynthesis ATPase
VEDTPEIQPRPGNVVRRFTTKDAGFKRHAKEGLRSRLDRIVIGEAHGAEALELLDAVVTGHSRLSRIHTDSRGQALTRIQHLAACDERLMGEAAGPRLHATLKNICVNKQEIMP